MKRETDDTLLTWLSKQPERLEKHLDRCPEDIDRLERLTELQPHEVSAMTASVAAPADIAERVISRMRVDPRLKEAGAAFADLFGLGVRTMRVVFGGTDDDPDGTDADGPGRNDR